MIQVKRLGHATFSTPDLDRQTDYWTQVMGLSLVDRSPKRAILASKLGQESVVLETADHADLQRISFQVAPGTDLKALAQKLQKEGVASDRQSDPTPGIADCLTFTDPKGTTVEIFSDCQFHKRDASEGGVNPLKIGHVASRVNDVQKVAKFYQEFLGFRVSDWLGDHFVFMRCGIEHHTVNFVQYETQRLHHVAFEVKDWAAIHHACEVLTRNEIQLVWGPLRHIVGHNVAAYHRNSDDLRIECYCEMDIMADEELGYWQPRPWHEEMPLRPKKWPKETWRSAWGFGSFGTFPGYP
ncbi:MAG: glyoxalase [Rhizobiales bacterium 62-17]|mgnify:CR=1 FL=1|nr:VOC family protein [Hyphomicrobiales bacterium]OJY01083.1 MAG: glyoxalase [Rhizobiales bacterium 62-17]